MPVEPGDEKLVARVTAILEEHRRSFERRERALERQGALTRETRQTVDEGFERNERLWAKNLAAMDGILAAVADLGDQIRANTEATLRMLDRLGEDGQTA